VEGCREQKINSRIFYANAYFFYWGMSINGTENRDKKKILKKSTIQPYIHDSLRRWRDRLIKFIKENSPPS
jgi:hypothetical protein